MPTEGLNAIEASQKERIKLQINKNTFDSNSMESLLDEVQD